MSRVIKLGQVKTPTPSPGYIGYYPCLQANTDTVLTDRSGKGNHATFGADLTTGEAWVTANRFSVPLEGSGTQNNAANLAIGSGFAWNPATESFILATRFQAATTASNGQIFGTTNATPNLGFKLEVQVSGALRLNRYTSGAQIVVNTTAEIVADGTPHGLAMVWDAVTQRMYLYVDGVVSAAFAGGSLITATDWFPSSNANFCIGGVGHLSNKALTFASAYWGLHIAKRTGALPAGTPELIHRLNKFPHVLISATELPA